LGGRRRTKIEGVRSHKAVLLSAFLVAQAWIPQPQACDSKRQPDPSGSLPIVEPFTTREGVRLGVQILATNLDVPWSLAFAPDGRLFFTERTGAVRVMQDGRLLPTPALRLADVAAIGEAGVLGLTLDPQFSQNHFVYLAYTGFAPDGHAVNRLVRYRESNNTLGERAVLVDNIQASSTHDGGRIRFGPDGSLYWTMGDAAVPLNAQRLSHMNGKILRFNPDGTTPSDNPYGSPVWTWGHRNPQGLDWNPLTGDAWATEHGQSGNDELNLIRKGRNYGWPVIEGTQSRPDMETPVLAFTPSIAPSGLSFYRSTRMPPFRNDIFFATLRGMHIHRVVLDTNDRTRIAATERWLEGRFGRIRDVVTGPDGALYFCTSNRDGRTSPVATDDRIARIVPVQ